MVSSILRQYIVPILIYKIRLVQKYYTFVSECLRITGFERLGRKLKNEHVLFFLIRRPLSGWL